MKRQLFASACLLFIGSAASAAHAQQAPAPSVAPTAQNDKGIAEIVVTAEHRTQSVQKSSLAIDVLSASALREAGVSQVRDLATIEPGVMVGQGGPATQIYIRGIGDFGSTPNTNPGVATYIDGAYEPRSTAIEGNFYDLQRLEVLKGPQGTLYGRNSAGGALNILTNSPVLGQTLGAINAEVGSYQEVNVDGMFNVPIGDTLAVRGAFQFVSRGPYSSEGFDDDHKQSGRLTALWKPNSKISLRVTGAYTHVGGTGPGYDFDTLNFPKAVSAQLSQITGPGAPTGGVTIPTDPRISITDPRVANIFAGVELLSQLEGTNGRGVVGPFNGVASQPWCFPAIAANTAKVNGVVTPFPNQIAGLCNANLNGVGLLTPPGGDVATWQPGNFQNFAHQDNRYYNITAELNWDLGFGKLTVIPGYRRADQQYATIPTAVFDDDGGGRPEVSESDSVEVRLAKDTSLVDWTVGGYYFRERQSEFGTQYGGFLFNTYNPYTIHDENYAVFGQGTWHVSDRFRVITGIRYSKEDKSNAGQAIVVFPTVYDAAGQFCYNGPTTGCVQNAFAGKVSFDSINWKVGAEYDLTPLNLVYATAATGTKAGGLNTEAINFPTNDAAIPYKPEHLTAFEVGSRNQFFDRRLQVNLEGYYWIYRDHQENASYSNPAGFFVPATVNAGGAHVYGFDLNIIDRVTQHDTVKFSTEYNHSEYTDFTFASSGLIRGIDTNCLVNPIPGSTSQNINCKGFPLAQAPLWTGSTSWTHTFELSNGAHIDTTASALFSDERYLSNAFSNQVLAPAYVVANFDATYHSPDGRWVFALFGRNLNDEVTYAGSFSIRGLNHAITVVNVGAPRTFGARFGYNF